MEGGVERSLRNLERGARDLPNALARSPSRAAASSDSALRMSRSSVPCGSSSFAASIASAMSFPVGFYRRVYRSPCRSARGTSASRTAVFVAPFPTFGHEDRLWRMRSLTLMARGCRCAPFHRGLLRHSPRSITGRCVRNALALDRTHSRGTRARAVGRAQSAATSSTRASTTAACGALPITGPPGCRSSTSSPRLDRRDCRGALRSRHHLRGHRRRDHPARSRRGQRRLQVGRRRKDVDASRPSRQPDDRDDRRRSEQSRTGCSSRRSDIRTARTRSAEFFARRTAERRSRKCCTRMPTRVRTTCASIRAIRTSCTPGSGSSSRASSRESIQRRVGRHVQVQRRRKHLEAARRRAPDGAAGESRDRTIEHEGALRDGCGRAIRGGGRARQTEELGLYKTTDAGEHWYLAVHDPKARPGRGNRARSETTAAHRRRRSRHARSRSEERERRVQRLDRFLAHRERRRDVVSRARLSRRRRLSEGVGQSERSEHSAPRLGPGRGRFIESRRCAGATGTRSRPRRCTTCRRTTRSCIACAAGSRTRVLRASTADRWMARSPSTIGIPWTSRSTALRLRIRRTRTRYSGACAATSRS